MKTGNNQLVKKIKKKKARKVKDSNTAQVPSNPADSSCFPATSAANDGSVVENKSKDKQENLSGFIFMCSGKTKPECYSYNVFGLPVGRREIVEKIKVGTNLFLYDFEQKLLYGIYKATTNGMMNLEPAAFGGRYPAQVRFRVHKDYQPLHESAFRNAISDNYHGGLKFDSELSTKQVESLVSLFYQSPATPPVRSSMWNVIPKPLPPREVENQIHSHMRLPELFLAESLRSRLPPALEPQHLLGKDGPYLNNAHPAFDHALLGHYNPHYAAGSIPPLSLSSASHQIAPRYQLSQSSLAGNRALAFEPNVNLMPSATDPRFRGLVGGGHPAPSYPFAGASSRYR